MTAWAAQLGCEFSGTYFYVSAYIGLQSYPLSVLSTYELFDIGSLQLISCTIYDT